jgi:amidase
MAYDILLTPALAERPVPIGTITGMEQPHPLEALHRSDRFTPYTALWNLTGRPAISLPLFHGEDGLPLGVQLVGPPAGEAPLLALAAQLEQVASWSRRLSPVATGG